MSKILEAIQELDANQEAAGFVPRNRGGSALELLVGHKRADDGSVILVAGADGEMVPQAQPTEFSFVHEGERNLGRIWLKDCRFIGAHFQYQLHTNPVTGEPEQREKNGKMVDGQHVLDTGFVCHAEIRLFNDQAKAWVPLPIETRVWSEMLSGNPMLFLYGQHQGATVEGAEALRKLIQEDYGWVARPEPEGVVRKRDSLWNLQPRGAKLPEQIKLSSGALEVATLVVREADYARGNQGERTGFNNFVSAGLANHQRYLKARLLAAEDPDFIAVAESLIASITGARTVFASENTTRTINRVADKVVKKGQPTNTYPDRAGIAEFSLITGYNANGDPSATTDVSMWPSGVADEVEGDFVKVADKAFG